MSKFYIGTNWKTHMTHAMARAYIHELLPELPGLESPAQELFIIPSFLSLPYIREAVPAGGLLKIGAQNVHWEEGDEATGEISAAMLADLGIDLVEIGHSERRRKFGETDELVNRKTRAVLHHGMTALVCIGESRGEKESGGGPAVLERQIRGAFHGITPEQLDRVRLAYEPVWAIGSKGEPASATYVAEQHARIRAIVTDLFGDEAGGGIPILYGGSINPENYLSYATIRDVNGLFIGRSAWSAPSLARLARGTLRMLEEA